MCRFYDWTNESNMSIGIIHLILYSLYYMGAAVILLSSYSYTRSVLKPLGATLNVTQMSHFLARSLEDVRFLGSKLILVRLEIQAENDSPRLGELEL